MDGKLNILEETMAHMTYVQIEEAARKGAIILFPTGVIEEHGPHLPLSVDVYGSYLQSRAIKKELEAKEIRALIAPPFYWGINIATGSFGGSFTSREETVVSVLFDAMASLKRWGFQRVFFVNHHVDSGHVQALDKAARKGRDETGIEVFLLMDSLIAKRLRFKGDEEHILVHKSLILPGPPPAYLNIHAEAYETSFMWHYVPDLVNFEVWKTLKPTNLTLKDLEAWSKGGNEARRVTPQGYFGDPSSANPETGRREMEAYGKVAAGVIEDLVRGRYFPPR